MKRTEAICVRKRFPQRHIIQCKILCEGVMILKIHLFNATHGNRDEEEMAVSQKGL